MALLAHQLRTPLSTINALAQGLMRRADRISTDEIRGRAEKIWRASLRLNELIETIMSYTRASTGGILLSPSEFNPEALIRRACREQGGPGPEHPLNIDIQNLPTNIIGDPILLEQALVIILSNAMKYSPPDRAINVSAHAQDGSIAITIQDHGTGISKEDLPFLMQPFFRGQNAKNVPGTGLGLSLAWHILKLHGGNLEIQSQEGKGTAVTMIVPEKNIPGYADPI
jgi:signal transduction histidine kinase